MKAAPPFLIKSMDKAAKVITGDLLGYNVEAFIIGDIQYSVKPPTIKVMSKAIYYLANVDFREGSISDAIKEIPVITDDLLKGLSCFICGDENLCEQLKLGTFDEVKEALDKCISLISTSVFQCAALAKNVAQVAAKQKL